MGREKIAEITSNTPAAVLSAIKEPTIPSTNAGMNIREKNRMGKVIIPIIGDLKENSGMKRRGNKSKNAPTNPRT